ncbi:MAG: 3-methyl-2-oxobutanoate hydroxymethyltransferase [Ardenticatenaceae bacterium]|nr:3-methyl-2-oxobutanoate hydroxymethyltransferase [Ardenticatenaceae bacterium]MCB9442976.1 3-methyl-2-oxobutanoate hydroxymethyltransferase [Ardenticatenaceae bacterium]
MSRKKVTILDLQRKKNNKQPLTMLTAYDFTGAQLVDNAEIDVILVGDSLGMVVLGYDSTVPVTMAEMLHHCRAVARGTQYAFTVGDMPFLSYQADMAEAVRNAGLLLKEGRMDSVKLEGGREMALTVEAVSRAGIPVMGHIGLTPQSQSKLGGYRVQGKTAVSAHNLVQDALALEAAGCYSIVLEAVPEPVAIVISQKLTIPTFGIGAGAGCDGQVLVYHDLLGLFDRLQPRFVKQYARLGQTALDALVAFREDVINGRFPTVEHTYPMSVEEEAEFRRMIAE